MEKEMLRNLADGFKQSAVTFMKKDGYLTPVVFFLTDKGLMSIPQLTEIFNLDKNLFSKIMKTIVQDIKPVAVIQINEAYIKKISSQDEYDHKKSVQENGGTEVAMVNIETKEENVIYVTEIIKVNDKPKLKGDWEEQWMSKDNVSGRLVDFFQTSTLLDVSTELVMNTVGSSGFKKVDFPKIDA